MKREGTGLRPAMDGARRLWSAEAHPVPRLGAALAASVALHLGVMPGVIAPGPGGPGPRTATAEPLRAWIVQRSERRPSGERADSRPTHGGAGESVERGIPVLGEARYFPASELDHRPTPLLPIEPRSPGGVRGRTGRVVMNLFIDQDGRVDKIVLVSSDHPFDESALGAFRNARFSPGVRSGAAVKSQMLIEVTFRPDETPASAPSVPAPSG